MEDLLWQSDNVLNEICLRLDKSTDTCICMLKMSQAWQQQAAKLESGEISKEEYDEWLYKYPSTYQGWAKVPFKELSDYFLDELNKELDK